jgi:hypothetical protein
MPIPTRILAVLTACLWLQTSLAQSVSRNLADLESIPWKQQWSTASGSFKMIDDTPAGDNVAGSGSMLVDISFQKGFQYYNITPVQSKIPGQLKSVSLWGKRQGTPVPCIVTFKVKTPAKGKKYEWSPKLTGEWSHHQFKIPADWPPVVSVGITSHNWSNKHEAHSGTFVLNNFLVTTDMSGVKDKSSLLSVSAATGKARNIFRHNEPISYTVNLGSWIGKPLNGTLNIIARDVNNAIAHKQTDTIVLDAALSQSLSFKPKRFGIYTVDILIKLDGQPDFKQRSRCAWIPEIEKSTDEEKRYSPWAINIHGGIEGVSYDAIATLGFCWIRDYAYTYDWLRRGYQGGSWEGWPWYLPMDRKIKKAGLKVLPCMSRGIHEGIVKHPEPQRDWKNHIVRFMMKFPEYDAYEPDNELDLHIPKELAADKYQSYGKYHKHYQDVVHMMNPDAWAVTQGTAGFRSEVVRQMIKEGYFKDYEVINGHFYTGIYPALMSQTNENTGQGGDTPMHFYDRLREFVKAADIDGVDRQAWITEFGWDTLAVKIVNEREQAAYAQRGFTIGLIGGVDKMFWYWNLDTKKKVPDTYFDGMGIFDPKEEPKPVAAAIAAMIHFLKMPEPVGMFEMGPNSFGHVFKDRGRLVALAFKIDKDKPGPKVTFRTGKIHDMYGNPLKGRTHELDITPIWIDGIAENDLLVQETVYDLSSNWLVLGAGGDECIITVDIKNTRKTPINASFAIDVPKKWSVTKKVPSATVAPGTTKRITFKARIDPKAAAGNEFVVITATDGKVVKRMETQVQVIEPATLGTVALEGQPGKTKLTFKLHNNSLRARSFVVKPKLPGSWKAEPREIKVNDLAAKSTKDVTFTVTWSNDYSEKEVAEIAVFNHEGTQIISKGIVPNSRSLPRVQNIVFDGDFSDWPRGSRLPGWAIGRIGMPESIELYAAYGKEGLYIGARIAPSMAAGSNPKIFWSMDCLEVCVDARNDKTERQSYNKTDHQFWIVPMVDKGKAYLGRWKRSNEIPKIQYDIQGVKSSAKRIKGGYAMELLIPASQISGFKAQKGNRIGLSLNITAPGRTQTITCYWPLPKTEGVINRPDIWANAEMK